MQMTGRVHHFLVIALLMLSPAMAGAAEGDAAPPATTREEQLEELDEVVVRSKRLKQVIEEAENRFFKLYNEINKEDKYDVNCPYVNVSNDRGSNINSRVCLPVFVADSIADYAVFKAKCEPEFSGFDANKDGRISRFEAAGNGDLAYQFDELDQNEDGALSEFQEFEAFERWALMNMNCYRPPTPELVLMDGSAAWQQNMMKVANSDPRLREMAGKLDELHVEMRTVNREFEKFEVKSAPREIRKTVPRPR